MKFCAICVLIVFGIVMYACLAVSRQADEWEENYWRDRE